MEDANGEWEIQEYGTSESNIGGKVSWILGLGKKVLLTGFVISSAPLVLPPLMVISAIGFAVSVPSGIVLASYACTEKLMSKLLPMPYQLENGEVINTGEEDKEGNYYFDLREEEEEEIKDREKRVESRIELDHDEIEDKGIDYGKDGVYKTDVAAEENGYEEDVGEYSDVGKENMEENEEDQSSVVDESSKNEEAPVKVEGFVLNLTEGGDEENGETTVEVTRVVIEGNGGEETEEEMAKETKGLLENIRDEGKADQLEKDKREIPTEDKTIDSGGGDVGLDKPKDQSTSEAEKLTEEQSKSSTDDRETPKEVSTNNKGDQRADTSVELPVSHGAQESKNAASSSQKGDKSIPSNEGKKKKNVKKQQPQPQSQPQQQLKVLYNEEKIWEQIEAVRGIVGYKATPQTTSIEELKALYIFTGVEPPESFKEPSDLAEVDNKLQFLKSIIGVI